MTGTMDTARRAATGVSSGEGLQAPGGVLPEWGKTVSHDPCAAAARHARFDAALASARIDVAQPLPQDARRMPFRLFAPTTWRRPAFAQRRIQIAMRQTEEAEEWISARASWPARLLAAQSIEVMVAEAEDRIRAEQRRAIQRLHLSLFLMRHGRRLIWLALLVTLAAVLWWAREWLSAELMRMLELLRGISSDATPQSQPVPPPDPGDPGQAPP